MCLSSNVADVAVQLTYTFETGFTNMQFVALATDALESGDVNFANMISSIQTDEARHAQQGGPTLEILMEHDPARAQWVVDKMFWLASKALPRSPGPRWTTTPPWNTGSSPTGSSWRSGSSTSSSSRLPTTA